MCRCGRCPVEDQAFDFDPFADYVPSADRTDMITAEQFIKAEHVIARASEPRAVMIMDWNFQGRLYYKGETVTGSIARLMVMRGRAR
jgi:hypothetical protein